MLFAVEGGVYGAISGLAGVAIAALATYSARKRDKLAQSVAAEAERAKIEAARVAAEQARRVEDLSTLNAGIDFLTTALGDAREELTGVKKELRECEVRDRAKDRRMQYLERLLTINDVAFDD